MDIMDELIWPDIFGGAVKAFFTRRSVGADVDKISSILSIECIPARPETHRQYSGAEFGS
jgi:hypothetical protein